VKKAIPPEAEITDPALRPVFDAIGKVWVALGDEAAPMI
jgi:hypothetical protein